MAIVDFIPNVARRNAVRLTSGATTASVLSSAAPGMQEAGPTQQKRCTGARPGQIVAHGNIKQGGTRPSAPQREAGRSQYQTASKMRRAIKAQKRREKGKDPGQRRAQRAISQPPCLSAVPRHLSADLPWHHE